MIIDLYYYHKLSKKNQLIYKKIREALLSHKQIIELRTDYVDIDSLFEIFKKIIFDNPMLYYVKLEGIQIETGLGGYRVYPQYYFNEQECIKYNELINKYTKSIIRQANVIGKDDYSIVRSIHDLLAKNIEYNKVVLEKECNETESCFAHTILGVILEKRAVCDGIAKTFKYLLNMADIGVIVVVGEADNGDSKYRQYSHAWNIVKINGDNYHIDLTWDITGRVGKYISYDFFNMTDSQISKTHVWKGELPICDKEKYNYFVMNNSMIRSDSELENYINRFNAISERVVYLKIDYNCDFEEKCNYIQSYIVNKWGRIGFNPHIMICSNKKTKTLMFYFDN